VGHCHFGYVIKLTPPKKKKKKKDGFLHARTNGLNMEILTFLLKIWCGFGQFFLKKEIPIGLSYISMVVI
jgi:hypothetical protein